MSYYRRPREHWEREISTLDAKYRNMISQALRATKELTRFRYGLIDLKELERKLRIIKNSKI